MTGNPLSAPADLGPAGRTHWDRIVGRYELEAHELTVLEQATRELDKAAICDAIVAKDAIVMPSKSGPRIHPAVVEARLARLAFARLMGQLSLPAENDERPMTETQRRAQRAGRARWNHVAEIRGGRRGAAS